MISNPPPGTAQNVALPYEYDEYYNTRVARPWSRTILPFCLGVMFILIGVLSLVFSCVDFARSAVVSPFANNPNYAKVGVPARESPNLAATWQENSIWPTLGMGLWFGLFLIGTGILGICSRLDGSHAGLHVFNLLSWMTVILAFYVIMSCILSIEVYPYNGTKRNYQNNLELAMNSLILALGVFAFILALIGALKSCVHLDYCSNGRHYRKYGQYGPLVN